MAGESGWGPVLHLAHVILPLAGRLYVLTSPSNLTYSWRSSSPQVTERKPKRVMINILKAGIQHWILPQAGVAGRDVGRLLHSGDPRYGIPSQAALLGANIEDIKNWLTPQLATGQIEITVVGDVDKDAVIKHVARTFATLPKRKLGHKAYPDMTKITFPQGP